MSLTVSVRTVAAMKLAAVRRQVAIGGVGAAWRPALDKVWDFLRTKPGLRTDGHNVFLYHHPARRDMPMDVDFGVEVVRAFEPEGEVNAVETPAGEAAVAVHVGSYDRMKETHDAIHAWRASNNRAFAERRTYGERSTIRRNSKPIVSAEVADDERDRDLVSRGYSIQTAIPETGPISQDITESDGSLARPRRGPVDKLRGRDVDAGRAIGPGSYFS